MSRLTSPAANSSLWSPATSTECSPPTGAPASTASSPAATVAPPTALAGLCRQLAAELGPSGVRVAWLLSPGSPEPGTGLSEAGQLPAGTGQPGDPGAAATLLGRRPTYGDVANTAAYLASDWARTMTATEVNITGGAVVD